LLLDYLCEQSPSPIPAAKEAPFSAMDLHFRLAKGELSNLPTPEEIRQLGDSWTLPASIALACRLAGQEEAWQVWLTATVETMRQSAARDTGPFLEWIEREQPPQPEELQWLTRMDPGEKSLCCLLLSSVFPTERERLVALARSLHVGRMPPARLLDRALAAP
jgi:hypothetical protein